MTTTPEQIVAANKANVETLLTLANTAFASAERIAALNLNTARAVLEDTVASAKALMAAKDVQELLALQSSLAQPVVEKAVAYSRSIYEIASQTQEEVSKLFEAKSLKPTRPSPPPSTRLPSPLRPAPTSPSLP